MQGEGGGGGGGAYSRATHCRFNKVLRVVSYSINTEVIKISITVITLLPGQSPFTQIPSHHEQPCIADVHLLQLCVSSPHLSSAESQQNPLKKRKDNKENKSIIKKTKTERKAFLVMTPSLSRLFLLFSKLNQAKKGY